MKLYSKASSEIGKPASKGGNEYLNIELFLNDREKPRFRVHLNNFEDGTQNICIIDLNKSSPHIVWAYNITKGQVEIKA
jgi:hypothetical protein